MNNYTKISYHCFLIPRRLASGRIIHGNIKLLFKKINCKLLLNKTYFVYYQLHDLFHRFSEFLGFPLLGFIGNYLKKITPHISVRIPTNEMIVIAKKDEI